MLRVSCVLDMLLANIRNQTAATECMIMCKLSHPNVSFFQAEPFFQGPEGGIRAIGKWTRQRNHGQER